MKFSKVPVSVAAIAFLLKVRTPGHATTGYAHVLVGRRTFLLAVVLAVLAPAAPAHATIVYVKGATAIYTARDDGSRPKRVATGVGATISPNGRWVAYVKPRGTLDEVWLVRSRGAISRRLMGSSRIDAVNFSPDSTQVGVVLSNRMQVHDIPTQTTFTAAFGAIRGFSFSPDSKSIVWARAPVGAPLDAPSDLWKIEFDAGPKVRLTRDRRSLNPLWTAQGIVHVKQTPRAGDQPAYDLYEIAADGTGERRVTTTAVPQFMSGLVPLQRSPDGTRLLAGFVGQERNEAYAVEMATGTARSLGARFVPGGLSRDGRRVLVQTGGLHPADSHHVATVPWEGGTPTILVRRASAPRWTG
jgi:hypothetical protein